MLVQSAPTPLFGIGLTGSLHCKKHKKGRTNNSLKSSCNKIESPSNFVVNLLLFAGYLGGFTHILFSVQRKPCPTTWGWWILQLG